MWRVLVVVLLEPAQDSDRVLLHDQGPSRAGTVGWPALESLSPRRPEPSGDLHPHTDWEGGSDIAAIHVLTARDGTAWALAAAAGLRPSVGIFVWLRAARPRTRSPKP
jgi:hypothetical protein